MSAVLNSFLLKHGLRFEDGGIKSTGPITAFGGIQTNMGTGQIYYVDPANGSDNRNGKTPDLAFATLGYAETKLTANQNDILFYICGSSGMNLTEELVWDKNYTHLIGLCAPTNVAQRARIFNTAGATYDTAFASKALLKVTATGCIFKDLYLFQGADEASAYYGSVHVTGGRNYFQNVHFAGMGATASGSNAAHASSYALKLDGAAENTFVDCTIGVDTIVRTADNAIISLDGSAVRNIFKGCRIISSAANSAYPMVKLVDTSALDRYTIFDDCIFYNFWVNHGGTLLEAFEVPASAATHDIILKDCLAIGIDEWEANDRGQIWVHNAGGAATSGIGLAPAL